MVRAESRARLGAGVVGTTDTLWLQAEPVDEGEPTERARELARELKATLKQVLEHIGGRRLSEALRGLDDPSELADAAGWWPDLSLERKVELLETIDVEARVERVLAWAKEALGELELAERIRTDVSEGMESQQREFLLRRQMEAIRKELGEDDEEDAVAGYRERLAALEGAPEDVRKAVEREIGRLERTNPQAMEHGWIRTWLDTVFELPWGNRTEDHLDLADARAVLDADHHGLEQVKDRIVEHLAVRKLRAERGVDESDAATDGRGRALATVIALVGPPGVGKTSLGASIARALGRNFVRVALGGVRDESEIRGHRRTYVGAQPGRIVRAMTEAGSTQPGVPAGRDRQGRRRLAGRSLVGAARGAGPRAEPLVPRPLPRGRPRPVRGDLPRHREHARDHPRTAARPHGDRGASTATPRTRRWRSPVTTCSPASSTAPA